MASVIHEFASLVTVCDDGRLCSIENKRRSQLKCGNCDSHFGAMDYFIHVVVSVVVYVITTVY